MDLDMGYGIWDMDDLINGKFDSTDTILLCISLTTYIQ